MLIIFLDMDGVMNSLRWHDEFKEKHGRGPAAIRPLESIDPAAVKRLNWIISATGAKLVISSSWRHGYKQVEFREILQSAGVRGEMIDFTPTRLNVSERGGEIDAWLSKRDDVERFVILDDDSDMEPHMEHLLKTSWKEGLLDWHAQVAIKVLRDGTSVSQAVFDELGKPAHDVFYPGGVRKEG